eukprot:TRINITY_DN121403_c0_g1_i1.p1 TRINITY_DN121403_c0_g1~~TRINITY_DN121403_c0_g1_i1.p1  ORF type:complete len:409 (-),score=64.85 TRINITY_DN121403_c0_g1_i1:231-1457(-)
MPCVLWGVTCLTLPGPATSDVIKDEFRQALSLPRRLQAALDSPFAGGGGSSSSSSGSTCRTRSNSPDDSCTEGGQRQSSSSPRVDLYRLVPILEQEQWAATLGGEDRVLAHLPDASFSCLEIEEVYRQRDDAELRYDRARESLAAVLESLDGLRSSNVEGSDVQRLCQSLRRENKALRYKLDQSEVLRRELQESASMLQHELALLAKEVLQQAGSQLAAPPGSSPAAGLIPEHPGADGQADVKGVSEQTGTLKANGVSQSASPVAARQMFGSGGAALEDRHVGPSLAMGGQRGHAFAAPGFSSTPAMPSSGAHGTAATLTPRGVSGVYGPAVLANTGVPPLRLGGHAEATGIVPPLRMPGHAAATAGVTSVGVREGTTGAAGHFLGGREHLRGGPAAHRSASGGGLRV